LRFLIDLFDDPDVSSTSSRLLKTIVRMKSAVFLATRRIVSLDPIVVLRRNERDQSSLGEWLAKSRPADTARSPWSRSPTKWSGSAGNS